MTEIKIITCFTMGKYEKFAIDKLFPSCKKYGYKFKAFILENTGTWQMNVRERCKVYHKVIEQYLDKDMLLVFLDSDAEILQSLDNLRGLMKGQDAGYHFYRDTKLMAGTQCIKPNKLTLQLYKEWDKVVRKIKDEHQWEQNFLDSLVIDYRKHKGLKVIPLSPAYTYCKGWDKKPEYKNIEPIIVHDVEHNQTIKELDRRRK